MLGNMKTSIFQSLVTLQWATSERQKVYTTSWSQLPNVNPSCVKVPYLDKITQHVWTKVYWIKE